MVRYCCGICSREFSTPGGLRQHANTKHHGRTSLSQRSYTRPQGVERSGRSEHVSVRPEHDESLWNTPIASTRPQPHLQASMSLEEETPVVDVVEDVMSEPRHNLHVEMEDNIEENIEDNEEESEENIEELEEDNEEEEEEPEENTEELEETEFNPEDFQGASLDDALETIEGKNKPECITKWPNDAYRDFMKLIVDGNISNKIGDKIIKFFNKYSNLKDSPLPKSAKNGKDYLNQINSPSVDFKEKVIATNFGVDFKLYYRPIFRAIQALIQRPEVNDNFVNKGILRKDANNGTRIFGEPYEGDWWLKTEMTLPPLNHLLSIILYSDATTFDGLGKTSGHPVFLTLGNIPNWLRNNPESKVLLGFLPKVQDSGIKTTESFRSFQREVYHKCFNIMLRPLLEKPDALHFGIRGRVMIFAARISFFLADMLEADEVTATYKSANCRMPCHTCMILRDNLNQMALEQAPLRTHENMQQVIDADQGKDYSIHHTKNAFWKFP